MPLYFSELPPTCPISLDQIPASKGPYNFGRPTFIRKSIPLIPAHDLPSALASANIARSIVTSITKNKVINNVYSPKTQGFLGVAKTKYKTTRARWVEQTNKRIKRQYKYYGKNDDGSKNKDISVTMERIERMVWYDRAWKSYLTWEYGDKGEGERVR